MSTVTTSTRSENSDDLPIFAEYQGKIDEVLAALDIPDPKIVPSFLAEVQDFTARHARERADEIAAEVATELAGQEPLRLLVDEPEEAPEDREEHQPVRTKYIGPKMTPEEVSERLAGLRRPSPTPRRDNAEE